MAIPFLSNIDLNKNQALQLVLHNKTSDPSAPVEGQIYYNSSTNKVLVHNGSNFISIAGDIESVDTTTSNQLTVTNPNSIAADTSGTAAKVTVTEDTSSNTNFNVVYHNGSNALLDESSTGGFTYNPHTETLSVKNLSVTVKTTQKDVEVINTSGGIIFEGDTADDNETTLDVIDPTQDNTINLPNASGTVQLTGDATREVALTLTPGGSSGQQGHITKSTNTYTVDHRLGTRDVACQVYHTSNYDTVHVDVTRATVNTVEVAFGQSVTNGDYKILITKIG